jgi:outer membrane protein OmpA-like peptidoglycan-associated protein
MRPALIVGLVASIALTPASFAPASFAPAAYAQVTLDLHALDKGQGQAAPPSAEPAKPERPIPRSAARPPHRPVAKAKPPPTPASPAPVPEAKAPPSTPQPAQHPGAALPVAPPPGVSLPPIVVQPPAGKPEPPPVPPIAADAGGGAAPIKDGLRVLFATSRADLTESTQAAIKTYLNSVPRTESTSFDVTAYAAGGPEDPSTPRRLSLSRALAIRSVMLADGVASVRIYLRALGAAHADGPEDRVDVVALGTNGLPKAGSQARNEEPAKNEPPAKNGVEPPK